MTRLPVTRLPSSVTAAAAAAVLFALSLVAFLLIGAPGRRIVSVFQSGQDPRQAAKLAHYLQSHGGQQCAPSVTSVTPRDTYVARALAVARVSCNAIGTGADSLIGYRFSNASDLAAWKTDQHNFVAGIGVVGRCEQSTGQGPWADTTGALRGQLYCEGTTQRAEIAWSDDERLSSYVAFGHSSSMAPLVEWWETNIKGLASGDQAGARALHVMFDRSVEGGLSGCNAIPDPVADAVLQCGAITPSADRHDSADGLTLYHFRNAAALDIFFKAFTSEYRAPTSRGTATCNSAALVSETYSSGGKTAGSDFCYAAAQYPSGSAQYLLWTIDSVNIAALISRNDENERALYRVWQWLPG